MENISDDRVPCYLVAYPFMQLISRELNVLSFERNVLIDARERVGFLSKPDFMAKVKQITEHDFLPQEPYVIRPDTLKLPNARAWYPLTGVPVCRQCYAYWATRSCCPHEEHKTLCSDCEATKCDDCGAVSAN